MLQKLGILAAMLPVSLCASAYDFVADGIAYKITSFTEFECSVAANDSSYRGDITIPETVSFNGRTLTVKSIGDSAFYQNEALTSVTIPATVTTIGKYAFDGCVNLQTITLPDGLTDIGSYTFYGCSSIESIELPASLTEIGSHCFSGCTALSKIELPAAVSKLPNGCFIGCSNLKYMDLSNVETIGESAFAGCTNLAEVKFGDKLCSIGKCAFQKCGLEEFTIPNSVTSIGSSILANCDKLQSFTLGNGITWISTANNPISGCTNVKKFIIADGATALTYDNGESNKYETLYGNAPFEFVYIGRAIVAQYGNYYYLPFKGNTHIKTVEIGEFVTNLLPYKYSYYGFFEDCTSLDSIKIQGLPTIPENFAKGDTALKYVEISNKTTKIESGAFSGCSSLETIVLKTKTPPTYEDESGFTPDIYINCRLLISEGTDSLYKKTSPWNNFWNIVESPECTTEFTIGNLKYTVIAGNDVSVSGNDLTDTVHIPSQVEYYSTVYNVVSIPEEGFANSTELTAIFIPGSIKSIGNDAFLNCTSLNRIEIAAASTPLTLGYNTTLHIPSQQIIPFPNPTTVDEKRTGFRNGYYDGLFYGLPIERLVINRDIELPKYYERTRGSSAQKYSDVYNDIVYYPPFYDLTKLKYVEIGENVSAICQNTVDIVLNAQPATMEYTNFGNCNVEVVVSKNPDAPIGGLFSTNSYETATLFLPNGGESSYAADKYWSLFKNIRQSELVPIDSLKFEEKELAINLNESKQLVPHIYPDSASIQKLKWTSSAPGIVSVADDGTIASNTKKGEATITATTTDGTNISDTIIVKIFVPIDSLKFEEKELMIDLNESKRLVPHIYPAEASIQELKWTSSAPDIVSVADDGTIASNTKKGEATITATTTDGTNISDTIIVKIFVPIDSLKFEEKELMIDLNESKRLVPHIYPAEASIQELKWTSSAPDIVSVADDGTIASNTKKGEATITATTTDGTNISDSIIVKVGTEAGIGEVISESATISVSAENNTIVITGKLAEQIVNVYDIQGRLIATTTQDHVSIKEHGTYIVRIAHFTFKIVL